MKKLLIPLAVFCCALFTMSAPILSENLFKIRDRILASDFLAIQAAMPEFELTGLKIDEYEIIVGEQGNRVFVSYSDPNHSPEMRGGSPNMAEFVVELTEDLRVVGSHYVR